MTVDRSKKYNAIVLFKSPLSFSCQGKKMLHSCPRGVEALTEALATDHGLAAL
jgi:hypothetical protein